MKNVIAEYVSGLLLVLVFELVSIKSQISQVKRRNFWLYKILELA